MKVYIAYKFKGADEIKLIKGLKAIDREVVRSGHESYIFIRDAREWGKIVMDEKTVLQQDFRAIENCDAVLAIVESEELSEGMLLEIGYAYAKGKKIYVLIDEKYNKDYLRLVRNLATKLVTFSEQAKYKFIKRLLSE